MLEPATPTIRSKVVRSPFVHAAFALLLFSLLLALWAHLWVPPLPVF